eukprot:43707-Pyramimonas_sp.AAC.1
MGRTLHRIHNNCPCNWGRTGSCTVRLEPRRASALPLRIARWWCKRGRRLYWPARVADHPRAQN